MKSENIHFTKDELKLDDDVDDFHISPYPQDGKTCGTLPYNKSRSDKRLA